MRKFLCLFFAFLICFATLINVSAAEVGSDGDDEASSSFDLVDDTGNLDVQENGNDNGGTSSSTSGIGDNEGSTESLDPSEVGSEASAEPTNPVVDISDESVQAIADAINGLSDYQYEYQYVLNGGITGRTITIDSDIPNLLDDYKVCMFRTSSSTGSYKLLIASANSTFTYKLTSGHYISFPYLVDFSVSSDGLVFTVLADELPTVSKSFSTTSYGTFVVDYANFHIYEQNSGDLFYESPYVAPVEFIISFNTGFEDYQIDSQKHTEFQLPENPSYQGYTFAGFYLDSEFTIPFDSTYEFTGDTTIYLRWIDEPDMAIFHTTIFSAFVELFTYEPMIYIFALTGLICIIAVGKRLMSSRY